MPGSRAPSDARTQGALGLSCPGATEDAAARRVIAGQAPPGGAGQATQLWSVAVRLISGTPASALETGQFSFACSAACSKAASSIPGTCPATSMAIFVMPSPGWNVTVAEVFSCSGAWPSLASPLESAIEKHAACAAAISSSGLVNPFGSSERAAQLTSRPPKAPLVTESTRSEEHTSELQSHVNLVCR